MASLPCRLCGLLGGLSRSITCRTASSAYMPANAEALRPSIARLSAATVTGFDLGFDFALDFTLRLAFAIFPSDRMTRGRALTMLRRDRTVNQARAPRQIAILARVSRRLDGYLAGVHPACVKY